ncbi:MAG: FIST C-terminal domain-containing protein [Candidatus Accumulibacter sp.]|jgi:hypothetical protein|nr:FIST C-terminal domain-containing protein [Accumulibacter sp.]
MIKILTAHTLKIDEADAAVAELLEQLDLGNRLLKNAVGIFTFHPEFLDSDVLKAVDEALPFATAGYTTPNAATRNIFGDMMFTVAVLTSDDVAFNAGISAPIAENPVRPVHELYARVAPPAMGKPALLLAFAPFTERMGGDDFVTLLDSASGGVPIFGSLAFTHTSNFSGIGTCANGKYGANALVLVALFGEVNPRFFITDLPGEKEICQRAIVTLAEGNRILRINNVSPVVYLESIGLAEHGEISPGIASFPFILSLNDGTRIARCASSATKEGYIIVCGNMPRRVKVGFSDADADFVVQSVEKALAQVASERSAENALIFSCTSRKWTLGAAAEWEMKEITKAIGNSLSFQFAYSGGEICPVKNSENRWVNRFHNFSMTTCLF